MPPRTTLLLVVTLIACEAADDDPGAPAQLGDGGGAADGGAPAPDAAAPDAHVAVEGGAYVIVADLSEGLGFGDWLGADVDAVEWRCGTAGGYALAATGDRDPAQAAYPVTPALGPPDGPCDPPEGCATPLGRYGYLAFQVAAPSLAGCEVTVYELADRVDDQFNVYDCPGPIFDNTCVGPVFSGTDGTAASGTF